MFIEEYLDPADLMTGAGMLDMEDQWEVESNVLLISYNNPKYKQVLILPFHHPNKYPTLQYRYRDELVGRIGECMFVLQGRSNDMHPRKARYVLSQCVTKMMGRKRFMRLENQGNIICLDTPSCVLTGIFKTAHIRQLYTSQNSNTEALH